MQSGGNTTYTAFRWLASQRSSILSAWAVTLFIWDPLWSLHLSTLRRKGARLTLARWQRLWRESLFDTRFYNPCSTSVTDLTFSFWPDSIHGEVQTSHGPRGRGGTDSIGLKCTRKKSGRLEAAIQTLRFGILKDRLYMHICLYNRDLLWSIVETRSTKWHHHWRNLCLTMLPDRCKQHQIFFEAAWVVHRSIRMSWIGKITQRFSGCRW